MTESSSGSQPRRATGDDVADGDADERTISWRELLAETESLLGDRRHARWICERATDRTPDEFRTILDDPATERAVHHLDAMVARARNGEPIQYVLGAWPFRHVDLVVDRRVLIPRPETEHVAEVAIDFAAAVDAPRIVVDLGTGSGAIGLAVADELPLVGTTVWLTDADAEALDVARANLAGLGRAAINVRVAEGSWYDALPEGLRADVIVSNPPYVANGSPDLDESVRSWEPSQALFAGDDGLEDLRTIIAGAPAHLSHGGWLVVEHGHDQGAATRDLLAAAGLDDVETGQDPAGLDRWSVGRRA
ncbi:MAG: peptide chain release factor N(5)-glutamine methyltransferase [Actinomycetota bacterium]